MSNKMIVLKNEFKRIGKDNLLIVLAVYPFVLAILGKFLVPIVRDAMLSPNFDLFNHKPALFAFFILVNPYIYGALSAFNLLDEREENTLVAIRVTPLKLSDYLLSKISIYIIVSIVTGMFVAWYLNFIPLTLGQNFAINVTLSLAAPMNMLLINAFAKNKVEGFAVVKGTGILMILPVAAFYIPKNLQLLAGVIPGFWPAIAVQKLADPSYSNIPFMVYLLIGAVYISLVTVGLYKRLVSKIN